ncbi:MAG: SLC13 family permease [bacterium]
MTGKVAVHGIFIITCLLTIYLILRRPYLYLRLGRRNLKIESYFLGALLGPLLITTFGVLDYHQVVNGLKGGHGLNPCGILILFLSMVFMSIFLDITGFFECCARIALKWAGADGKRLFFSLYVVVSLLTVFTSNDIIILTFTPFIYYFATSARIDPKPYLIAEFFAANTWSMMLYIGNPTNILLAAAFGLPFDRYFKWMVFPTLAAGAINMFGLFALFRKSVSRPIVPVSQTMDPLEALTDKTGALLGLLLLGGCIFALAVAPRLGVAMWVISLAFALALLAVLILRDSSVAWLRKDMRAAGNKGGSAVGSTLRRMPWTVVPFVLSLFITVEALHLYGITSEVGLFFKSICGTSSAAYGLVYGVSSALSANFLNNIPMSVAFVSIIRGLSGKNLLAAALATAAGSNLGANLTPIGALAGIMWMSILHTKDFRISFKEFMRYGLIITPLTLIACLGILALELAVF